MPRLSGLLKRPVVAAIEAVQSLPLYRSAAARFRPDVRITEATEADVRAVRAWFGAGEEENRPQRRAPGVTDLVAKHGNRIVGFVQLVSRSEDAGPHAGFWLYSLRVRLTYRGMGLGETLCQRVIDLARQDGAKELSLVVHEHNRRAAALYCKLGFEKRAVPELDAQFEQDVQARGRRRMVMSKAL